MTEFDRKINEHYPGLVVRKDLVKTVKGNAIVPSYVLEYLLGQYCATSDEASIQSGIETVKEILRKHYVHRNEAGLIRSTIREKGRYKVIDRIHVDLNTDKDAYEADFANLGIDGVLVASDTIKKHPKLLVGGVWCICDVEYAYTEDKNASPWIMNTIKPIQLSHFDFDEYIAGRRKFSTDEWIDLLFQSIGFNPDMFGKRSKLTQLVRLIPHCERNYNLIELGPKGTGKSHIYSEFSPHGILLSGGEVTVAKLFVNNATGRIGLVGYWDVVAFDEFAGKNKRTDRTLVDILKNYMANKSFSRGIDTLGAEASIVFVGNTQHTLPYMLKHSDLFDDLPDTYHDSAFLDRLHYYIPGWEVDIIRGEMFSNGYGFVVDYLAEILRNLRNHDYSQIYAEHFTLSTDISTRDRDGINKTFSGLMKILFPERNATRDEIEEILGFSMEGRKRVKDQLMRIDPTYVRVNFEYTDSSGEKSSVRTLEEKEYPQYYPASTGPDAEEDMLADSEAVAESQEDEEELSEKHLIFQENQRGVSFDVLFGPYLKGAANVVITDPYVHRPYQARNLMELLETIIKHKQDEDEVEVLLHTTDDGFEDSQQIACLEKIQASCATVGIRFSWTMDAGHAIHARHIVTDHGWKILLDRGLDVFQPFEMNDIFGIANRLQKYRPVKAFEITYLKADE